MPGSYNRKDSFYRKAKEEGYRSRAAFKLLELNKKHKILENIRSVLDLGCSPGGWLQVVLEKCAKNVRVIGVDIERLLPFTREERGYGAQEDRRFVFIEGDILSHEIHKFVIEQASGRVDLILSDISPKLSGIKFRDAARQGEIVSKVLQVSEELLSLQGKLVVKMFPGQEAEELILQFKKIFKTVTREYLDSTRKTSTEFYLVCKGFRG